MSTFSYQHQSISEIYTNYRDTETKPIENTGLSNVFLISKLNSESNIYSSRRLDYGILCANILNTIEGLSVFNPTGKWIINAGVTINNKIVKQAMKENDLSCVVTLDILSSTFLSLFTLLSNEIYVKNHIPSSVGEIIYSTNKRFRTEAGVKAVYGNYTSWEQIPGRFIYGKSSAEPFNEIETKGGTVDVTLKITDIPKHSHTFEPTDDEKEFNASFTLESTTEEGKQIVVKGDYPAKTQNGEANKLYTGQEITVTAGAELIESATIYGNKGPGITIKTNRYNEKPHNNMPPFHTVYIWKRIA